MEILLNGSTASVCRPIKSKTPTKGEAMEKIRKTHSGKLLACFFIVVSLSVSVLATVLFERRGFIVGAIAVTLGAIAALTVTSSRGLEGARRSTLTAIMAALAVVGRFIPIFKPVAAITILSGAYLGAESGFLVGSVSALVSNIFFGHGPWTPFQMLGWGLIGYASGLLSHQLRRSLARRKVVLCIFGALCALAYSLVMDVWSVLWYEPDFSLPLYLGVVTAAMPHTVIYLISNVGFLLLLGRSFGKRLERIEKKYGI